MATPYNHAVVANDESSMSLALKTTSDLEMKDRQQKLRLFHYKYGCWHLFKFPVLWFLVLVLCVCKLEGATFSLVWILAPLMFWTGIDFGILVVDEIIRCMEKQKEGESTCRHPLAAHHNQDPLLGSIVTVHSASPPPSPSRPQQQIDVLPQIDMDETTLRSAMYQLYDPGILIVAHKFGGNKPKTVRLRLTEHGILWRTETRNKSKDTNQPKLGPLHQVSLSHIQHVLTGKHTTTLRSVETASVSENLCVSLCFVEGTLHFEADSPRDRNVWLACFTLVLRHKIFVPAFMDIVYEAMVREDMFPGVRDDVKAEIFRMQAQDFRDKWLQRPSNDERPTANSLDKFLDPQEGTTTHTNGASQHSPPLQELREARSKQQQEHTPKDKLLVLSNQSPLLPQETQQDPTSTTRGVHNGPKVHHHRTTGWLSRWKRRSLGRAKTRETHHHDEQDDVSRIPATSKDRLCCSPV